MQPPSVFDPPTTLPFESSSETSLSAAQAMEDHAPIDLHRVYYAILMAGASGCTDQEVQDQLRLGPQTESPRRRHLVQMGIVADSGRTRPTRSGRSATVWVSTGKPCPGTEQRRRPESAGE